MAPSKGKFWEYFLTPLDFSGILKYPHHLQPWAWIYHVSRFWGQPHLTSIHLSSFINFIVSSNIIHEDVLMKDFTFYLNGNNAWEWYCDFIPKEIKSFPYFIKKIQKYLMYGYGNEDHGTNLYEAYFWVDNCAKIEKNIVGLIIFHENNSSNSLFVDIKMRYDVYAYSLKYTRRKFAHFKNKFHLCSPSHEPLSYYIS